MFLPFIRRRGRRPTPVTRVSGEALERRTLLAITNPTVDEGAAGTTVDAEFTISFALRAEQEMEFNYQTVDGTATAASGDYTPTSGTFLLVGPIFGIQTRSHTVRVPVRGDAQMEPNETFFLEVTEAFGGGGDFSGTATIRNDDFNMAPVIQSFTDSPDPVSRNQTLTLSVAVFDLNNNIASVSFFRESDGAAGLTAGDVLLGTDGGAPYQWSPPINALPPDTYTYYARAVDTLGESATTGLTNTVRNVNPVFSSFTDSPDPAPQGGTLTLAAGVTDPDGAVSSVQFYREGDGNGALSAGDELLGTDPSSPYQVTVPLGALAARNYTYYARATDGDGGQAIASTTNTVSAPPVIAAVTASPNPVTAGAGLTLTADGVSDPDGQAVTVFFYRESNGTAGLQRDGDAPLGSAAAAPYRLTVTAPPAGGGYTYYAVAQDASGGEAVASTGVTVSERPALESLTVSPDPVAPGGTITLTANGVTDPGGEPVNVEFYREANSVAGLQTGAGGDTILGSDGIGSDGYRLTFPVTGLPVGTYTYYARPVNQSGAAGAPASATSTVSLPPPVIGSLQDSPDPVVPGGTLTLTATGVTDPDGAADVASVTFYRETNSTPGLQTGAGGDSLLGSDGIGSDGYSLSFPLTGLPDGTYTYYARAADQAGGLSNVATTTNTVAEPPPSIQSLSDSPDPITSDGTLTLSALNVAGPPGTAVHFYRETNNTPGLQTGPGGDALVASDTDPSNLYAVSIPVTGLAEGSYTYYAQAAAPSGAAGNVVSTVNTVSNAGPTIVSLTDSPDPVAPGGTLTLTANGVAAPPGSPGGPISVFFYRESNITPGLQSGPFGDAAVGTDADGADGYAVTVNTAGMFPGRYIYYAVARNAAGREGAAVSTTNSVSGTPDAFEANNSFETATNLGTVGSRSVSPLSIHVPDDQDFFRFTAANTGRTAARLSFPSYTGSGLAVLTIYDAQRQPIATSPPLSGAPDGDLPPALLFDAQQGQTYFLRVNSPESAVVGSYNLGVSRPATIGGLTDATDPSPRGAPVTLTATGVADPDGDRPSVRFYRESNGIAGLQPFGDPAGADTSVGFVTAPADGVYRTTVNTRPLSPGRYTYYAVTHDAVVGDVPAGAGVATVASTEHTLLDWQPTVVTGRHLFYWRSAFVVPLPEGEDGAVATDKQPLRPGQGAATFQNVSSYSRGINGVIVDLAWVRGESPFPFLSAADFDFAVSDRAPTGDGAQPTWTAAPAPQYVTLRAGRGPSGHDRVVIIWRDGEIRNQWLRVTVKATPNTGLAADDVFCYGNLVGETGDEPAGAPGPLRVTPRDLLRTRAALFAGGGAGAVGITNPFDHNRDGRVTVADYAMVRRNLYQSIARISAPAPAAPPGAVSSVTSDLLDE